ncbi:MAG TPA: hypothetical protein VGN83_11955 [Falsiroseomonas sp.]|jgi:hypothetical protein|nr:hypothetical protein [Falsiroseomonas sp.]
MSRVAAKIKAWLGPKITTDSGALSAEMGAEAVAIGDGTATSGSVDLTVKDNGKVAIAKGTATASSGATGEDAYADTGTFGAADGADLLFVWNTKTSGESDDAALSGSTTRMLAIDLPFDFKSGPKVKEFYRESEASPQQLAELEIEGSTAVSTADSDATGDATNAEAYTDAFAGVGYSDISAYANAIVG